jgi:valyl-tRNA synthetase
MNELPKSYDPKSAEVRLYGEWIAGGLFHGDPAKGGTPYGMVIPPPNVTGILHMGHALNVTIQDILIRWKRMQGFNATWVPGTDHAGIATQNVVERALKKEGKTRDELGREAFLERVWQWKEQYGSTIIRQLRKLGTACDWERTRFTLDEGLSRAVREAFVRLYDKGLIRRGQYIINWCPRCTTALSDEESEHQAKRGKLYHIRYAVESRPGQFIVVATTRPETLLGDVAVAVHPGDARYTGLLGASLVLPLLGRRIPVVGDAFVDPQFGTGAVKVTPAHDPNDFDLGRRHGLAPVNVMDERGVMNAEAGPYAGLDRFECRKRVLADLERDGLLAKVEDHDHSVGHCYRCHSVIEPRLSAQWFVHMKPLAEPAIRAVREGRVRFVPERWNGVYMDWMENIRDWCISRQIWWGHRIPVFTCRACGHVWAAATDPDRCPVCEAGNPEQDPDVLDTWFSSWLWPFSVFGWPERTPDLEFYYPGTTLVTASEIIFFWVARMIMAGYEFMGDAPFHTVYIHGTVRDEQGRKMSKSLGNSIDPLDIIETTSADALRASLMMVAATGQDVFLSSEKFEIGRNFGTKIWNAARFLQMHSGLDSRPDLRAEFDPARLSGDDRHLLARLHETIISATGSLEALRFNDYALSVHSFLWHAFCDWYVELSKDILYGSDAARKEQTLRILHMAFSTALRLLHPLMPFLTEELWRGMGYATAGRALMEEPWPTPFPAETLARWGATPEIVREVEARRELIRAARVLRAEHNLPPKLKADFIVQAADAAALKSMEGERDALAALLRAGRLEFVLSFDRAQSLPSAVTPLGTVFLSLGNAVDREAEAAKLRAQLEKAEADLARVRAKLGNEAFTSKAPREVVAQQEARGSELEALCAKLGALLANLAPAPPP